MVIKMKNQTFSFRLGTSSKFQDDGRELFPGARPHVPGCKHPPAYEIQHLALRRRMMDKTTSPFFYGFCITIMIP
jgi:hypothetical protein